MSVYLGCMSIVCVWVLRLPTQPSLTHRDQRSEHDVILDPACPSIISPAPGARSLRKST